MSLALSHEPDFVPAHRLGMVALATLSIVIRPIGLVLLSALVLNRHAGSAALIAVFALAAPSFALHPGGGRPTSRGRGARA